MENPSFLPLYAFLILIIILAMVLYYLDKITEEPSYKEPLSPQTNYYYVIDIPQNYDVGTERARDVTKEEAQLLPSPFKKIYIAKVNLN